MPNHGKKGRGGEESGGDEEKRRERKIEKLSNNSTESNREIKIECSLHFHVFPEKGKKTKSS